MDQQQPNNQSAGIKRLVIGACVCLGVLAVILGLYFSRAWNQSTTITLDDVRQGTTINFPQNAILAERDVPARVIDPAWAAKVVVPIPAGKTLISSLANTPDETINVTHAFAGSVPWWTPQRVVYEKLYATNQDCLVYLVVAEEGNDYAFYIEYFFAY
jgi:hypothetical protein